MVNKTLFIDNHNNSRFPGISRKSPIYILAVPLQKLVEIRNFYEKRSQKQCFLTKAEQNLMKPEQNQNLEYKKVDGKMHDNYVDYVTFIKLKFILSKRRWIKYGKK